MEIMVTDPENLGARIGLDELKRRKASRKQTAPAAEAPATAHIFTAKGQPVEKQAIITPVLVTKENASQFLQ